MVGHKKCHHMTTLAATSSRPNPEIQVVREVLAHPCAVFHPCTCGLRGGTAMVAAALISYSGVRSLLGRRGGEGDRNQLLLLHRRTSMLDRLLQTIHDLILASFLE
jgi:hypothetical protein